MYLNENYKSILQRYLFFALLVLKFCTDEQLRHINPFFMLYLSDLFFFAGESEFSFILMTSTDTFWTNYAL